MNISQISSSLLVSNKVKQTSPFCSKIGSQSLISNLLLVNHRFSQSVANITISSTCWVIWSHVMTHPRPKKTMWEGASRVLHPVFYGNVLALYSVTGKNVANWPWCTLDIAVWMCADRLQGTSDCTKGFLVTPSNSLMRGLPLLTLSNILFANVIT